MVATDERRCRSAPGAPVWLSYDPSQVIMLLEVFSFIFVTRCLFVAEEGRRHEALHLLAL
jgi:hypothetical protein